MAEYALVDGGDVKDSIIAEADFISDKGDEVKASLGYPSGTWILPVFKVGVGYKYGNSLFVSPPIAALNLTAPEELNLGIQVSGSGTITYQWKKDSVDISGETASTLTIDPSTATTDDGSYTCVVSDGSNSLESSACVVTVTA